MYDNALRCIESDYTTMLSLAADLGIIKVENGVVTPMEGVTWDYIGYKIVNDVPLVDEKGRKYIHVNLRTEFSLGPRIYDKATTNTAIQSALATPGRFFIVDDQGNGVMPEFPMRQFL